MCRLRLRSPPEERASVWIYLPGFLLKLLSASEYHGRIWPICGKRQKRYMFWAKLKDWREVVNSKVCWSRWIKKFGSLAMCRTYFSFPLSSLPSSNRFWVSTLWVKNSNICSGQEHNANKQGRWILRKIETAVFSAPHQHRGDASPTTKWALSHYPRKMP